MTRYSLNHELETRLEAVRQQFVRQRQRYALSRMALWTLIAVLVWVLPMELAPNLPWLQLLGVLAGVCLVMWAAWRWLRPLAEPVNTAQIARYIDEHHPELQDRLTALMGLEAGKERPSQLLVRRFLEESQTKIGQHAFTPWFGRHSKQRSLAPAWLLFLAAGGLLLWHYRHSVSLFHNLGWTTPQEAFAVQPGDAKVRPGEDLSILVKFPESHSRAVTLRWRQPGAPWQEEIMTAGDDEVVRYHQFSQVQNELEYQIQDGEDQSRIFDIAMWEPPEIQSIDLVYHYPEYLNLEKREVAYSGHITAVEGTRVELQVTTNKPLKHMDMVLESGEKIRFKKLEDLIWQGQVTLTQKDRYHLELLDRDGEENPDQDRYDMVVEPDKAPVIKIDFPRADMKVSLLDEISFDFRVNDDYALADFGLRYQVAGRDPEWISLKPEDFQGLESEGHYQLMLEDMNLSPGDLLTWTVYARDQKPNRPEYEEMAEPYFLEIRPFKRQFREAVTQAGLQGGAPPPNLVQKQKDVLIATWNLRKKAAQMDEETYEKDRQRIHQSQVEIGEEVKKGVSGEGGSAADTTLPLVIAEAVTHLADAAWPSPEAKLSQAADAEQRAFQMLLKMQPDQSQVSRSRQQGGQSGSSQQDEAMDELEMNRNRNFYEEENLTQQQTEAAAETLEDIKDLARRQKMLNDEIAKLISEQEENQDPEAMKRKLERLQEELKKNLEQLDEAQRNMRQSQMDADASRQTESQLDQAREQVQQAMDALDKEQLQQARSASRSASEKLEKASRELGEQTRQSAAERMADLEKEFAEMAAAEEAIREKLASRDEGERSQERLSGESESKGDQQELSEMKQALKERFREAMERAAKLAETTAGDQELLSRKMGDWLRETSRDGLLETMEETEEMVRFGMWDNLAEKEKEIAEKLAKAKDGLSRVATMTVGDETESVEKSLQALRELQQNWESSASGNSEEDMRRFAQGDYRGWLDAMRDVEDMLPEDHHQRPALNQIRREIEKVRKDYRREELEPKYGLFMDTVVEPLDKVIQQLTLDVARLREERTFVLIDDGSIPDRYRKKVADYFEALSHAERNPDQ